MKTLTEMLARQKALRAEGKTLIAALEAEKRDFTAEEQTRMSAIEAELDTILGDMNALAAQIDAAPDPDVQPVPAVPTEAAAEKARAADIIAACELAGKPGKAAGYVASDKTLGEVVAELQKGRVSARAQEVDSHRPADPDKPKASFARSIEKFNARVPGAA